MASETPSPSEPQAPQAPEPSLLSPGSPGGSPGEAPELPRPAEQGSGTQSWMITFADLVALLITFFVMLFAMSQVEQRKWQNLVNALSNRLDLVREIEVALPTENRDVESVQTLPGSNLDYLAALLEEHLAAEPLLGEALLQRRPDRLVISLPSLLLFPSGAADLDPEGERVVFALSNLLRNLNNRIEVTGSADPEAPSGAFKSNWVLSLVRATRVAKLLADAGYQRPIVTRGLGDSRFESLAPNLDQAQREALARRVDIAILDYSQELGP